jgi:polar amino acid transport system substrate-binding protein
MLLAALFAALPALARRPARAAAPLRILYDVFENPPLILGNGPVIPAKPGLTIQLLRMASGRAAIPITLTRTPWERGLYLLQSGQGDAIFASSYVEERTRYGVYPMTDGHPDASRKLFDQSYRLYVRRDSGIVWDGKTLTNLHGAVGATPGYAVIPVLRAMGVTVEEEPSHIANLRKLLAGRIEAYAELDTHVRALVHANPGVFDDIIELSPPVLTKPYYLMFSEIFYAKLPEPAERLWDAIAAVNASAAFQELQRGEYAD